MKLIIAISGILICISTASASPLAEISKSEVSVVTDLSSRKLTGEQIRKLKPAKHLVARPMRRIAR